MIIPLKFCYNFALACDVLFAKSDMLFSLCEVGFYLSSVHIESYEERSSDNRFHPANLVPASGIGEKLCDIAICHASHISVVSAAYAPRRWKKAENRPYAKSGRSTLGQTPPRLGKQCEQGGSHTVRLHGPRSK